MLSSSFRRVTSTLIRPIAMRSFATGPASGGKISDDMLAKLGSLSTQALVDGLWVMGWPSGQIDGARALAPGMKCVGRAVTMNFVPARPDIAQDKPAGGESPEYEAFEKCGPNEVLVMASVGPWEVRTHIRKAPSDLIAGSSHIFSRVLGETSNSSD
jgi:hypothetical protein